MKSTPKYTMKDFTAGLFWDVDIKKISFSENDVFIIERVALLGDLKDWTIIRDIYEMDKIRKVITSMRYLDNKSLDYYSKIFHLPKENFRCYTDKQWMPKHSPFWRG